MISPDEGNPPAKRSKAKPRRKPSPGHAFAPGLSIPLAVKMAVRSFYLLQGLQPAQIAPMVSLSAQQISNLVRRENWHEQRKARETKREQIATKLQDTRAHADIAAVVEAVAIRGEELSVRTLEHCSAVLSRKTESGAPAIDSKELQMASGAALNFVKIARMSRGLDARGTNANGSVGQGGSNPFGLAVFVVRGESREEVEARQAKARAIPIDATVAG